jgi:hypothetical protein
MQATTSHPPTSLVEPCLLVESYFSKGLSVRATLWCAPVCWARTGSASGHSTAVLVREVSHCAHESVGKGDACCRVLGRAAAEAGPAVRTLKATYGRGAMTIAASQGLT